MASQLSRERTAIERNGGRVTVITPNEGSIAAIGPNLMDAACGEAVINAGFEQGLEEADRLRALWGS
jgi:hypothetical protein